MTWDLFSDSGRPDAAPRAGQPARPAAGEGARPLTITRLNALAKQLLESAYPPLWVTGEVTGWKQAATGHCYFCLRDKFAQIRCVMFQADADRLPTTPDEGLEVRALGTLTLYEKRGDFQFKVKILEGAGAGGLWRIAFEKLRLKLEKEGLLAAQRKRPLPAFPGRVGVVTSPVGAALHDILNVIERRAPWTRVVFSPARVQGEHAGQDVARAIRLFSKVGGVDVVIVGRGGGAAEDLWAFNEEVVARAIAASPVPVVSAVGHEVDITIADLVADARAPTPSAAAELVVPDRAAIVRELSRLQLRLATASRRRVTRARQELTAYARDLDSLARTRVRHGRERLGQLAGRLDALSPLAALRRGYAVPLNQDSRLLRRIADFEPGERVQLRVVDGVVGCRVEEIRGSDA
jgi:exodeoxyribonuclease VII large subunit